MTRLLLLLWSLAPGILLADDTLYRLINERLSLMEQVAAHKWINQLPIEAAEREAFVVSQASRDGLQFGITTASSQSFFTAQIEAAKAIQHCWFGRWEQRSPPESAEDLVTVVRPALISLGAKIMSRLKQNTNDRELFNQLFDQELPIDCLPDTARNSVFRALEKITTYPDRMTQITDSGLLRVGTTGDYAPFSYSADNSDYSGIDIDLASNLAQHLDAELVFIKTSWPSLMQDLKAGMFDIGMSGISIIPARKQQAFFSEPYHIGGKSPITLCSRVKEFTSLEQIDQPGVVAIVNPGGTNERFLDGNLQQVTKQLHEDNRTIFSEIASGNADLMITDLIEVRLQANRHPQLCGSMPGKTLTYQEKGYMMPKDPALLRAVNLWLQQLQSQDTLQQTFERHLR